MTLKRLFVAGVIANAALLVVGGALIYRMTEYEPKPGGGAASPRAGRVAAASPGAAGAEIPRAAPGTVTPAVDRVIGGEYSDEPPESVPSDGQTGASPAPPSLRGVVPRLASRERRDALWSARHEVISGFSGFRGLVERCGAGDASLVLTLEASAGSIRVEGVRVRARGTASDDALACAQSALAGQVMPSPGAEPGRRWEAPL